MQPALYPDPVVQAKLNAAENAAEKAWDATKRAESFTSCGNHDFAYRAHKLAAEHWETYRTISNSTEVDLTIDTHIQQSRFHRSKV